MLIRRDDVEHLVIVGPGSETVIESGIKRPETFATTLAAGEPRR
jgi:hypothetical protein